MTIQGFDVDAYNKPGFDFGRAYAEGRRACYIKLGGDNLVPRYELRSNGGYRGQVNDAVAAGFEHIGSYWATGGNDQVASANFYLGHLHPACTFDVLDNEKLDDGRILSPSEAYEWFSVLYAAGRRDLWHYASRLGPWAADDYSKLAELGVKALVADYGTPPLGERIFTIKYPRELIRGHQHTSSAVIGGRANIDADVFTDDAFTGGGIATPENGEEEMRPIYSWYTNKSGSHVWIERVPGTGHWAEWQDDSPPDRIASGFLQQRAPLGGNGNEITESVRDMLYAAAMALRPQATK